MDKQVQPYSRQKMRKLIKNIEHSTVLNLVDQIRYLDGQIASKTLCQNDSLSLTLFAFEKGEEISSHSSTGDALIQVLDGVGRISISDKQYDLEKGQSIIMPAQIPHAVYALERFKMLLLVSFPRTE